MTADQEGQTAISRVSGGSKLPGKVGRAGPNNLPLPLSSFVGRSEAKANVLRLMAGTRLLTLTGPGGVGKTRLALEAASALLDEFDDGVWWVDLAPLVDAALVADAVALALRLPDDTRQSRAMLVGNHLRDKDLLLVLDNCEHLIVECAELVTQWLSYCPRLRILTTSREALRIAGETAWAVPPLSLPCLDETVAADSLAESEAGQLFLERALASRPNLLVTDTVARAIVRICCRLDGIPLAIELAAARVRTLSVPEIVARLDDSFGLLTRGSRTALPRQQTLRATLDWSYDLLTRREQKLFARLAVLVDFQPDAAQAVASDPPGPEAILAADVPDLLSDLVLKSLVGMGDGKNGRYRMLDTIRQYAWEHLSASGEVEQVRERHLAYYLALAERAESKLGGGDQVEWLTLLVAEHDNLRAALTLSEKNGDARAGLRLATALAAFWLRAGYLSEGREWLERALAACREVGPVRIKALYQAGWLAHRRGDYEQALRCARQSLALSRRHQDRRGMARALGLMGWISHARGDRDAAGPLLDRGLTRARDSGDVRTIARALLFLGDLCVRQGRHERAAVLLDESLQLYQQMGDAWSMGWALNSLGELARRQGNHDRAVARLGLSLALYQTVDSKSEIPNPLEALARTAADQGRLVRAARLWGAAGAARREVHALLQPSYTADDAPTLDRVRAALGRDAFALAWAEGESMTLAEAIALATEDAPPTEPARQAVLLASPQHSPSVERSSTHYGLTAREVQVLRLVSLGITDAEIAGRLVISPRTVGKHLQSIYGKLHLTSRSAATRWAMEHHLD